MLFQVGVGSSEPSILGAPWTSVVQACFVMAGGILALLSLRASQRHQREERTLQLDGGIDSLSDCRRAIESAFPRSTIHEAIAVDEVRARVTNNLGWKTVLGIYVWHAVYGLHLGAIYNPLPEDGGDR